MKSFEANFYPNFMFAEPVRNKSVKNSLNFKMVSTQNK